MLLRKLEILQETDDVVEPGKNSKPILEARKKTLLPLKWVFSEENIERCMLVVTSELPVRISHRDLELKTLQVNTWYKSVREGFTKLFIMKIQRNK